jgi:hypothetical protein
MGGGLLATNVEDIDSMKAKGRVFKRGGEDNEEDVAGPRKEKMRLIVL